MNIIKLGNSYYEVRIANGVRMVKADQWMEASQFVDWLANNKPSSEFLELVNLGFDQLKSK